MHQTLVAFSVGKVLPVDGRGVFLIVVTLLDCSKMPSW